MARNYRLKGAFHGCTWCGGRGCLQCDSEKEKAEKAAFKPLFTADRNDPEDMELLKGIIGGEALDRAFGPGGGGVIEIHENALIATIKQCLRKSPEES